MTERMYGEGNHTLAELEEIDAIHPNSVAKALFTHIREMQAEVAQIKAERRALVHHIQDAVHKAEGIYPAAVIKDGVRTERTERQDGWNDAVIAMGDCIDEIQAIVEQELAK